MMEIYLNHETKPILGQFLSNGQFSLSLTPFIKDFKETNSERNESKATGAERFKTDPRTNYVFDILG